MELTGTLIPNSGHRKMQINHLYWSVTPLYVINKTPFVELNVFVESCSGLSHVFNNFDRSWQTFMMCHLLIVSYLITLTFLVQLRRRKCNPVKFVKENAGTLIERLLLRVNKVMYLIKVCNCKVEVLKRLPFFLRYPILLKNSICKRAHLKFAPQDTFYLKMKNVHYLNATSRTISLSKHITCVL